MIKHAAFAFALGAVATLAVVFLAAQGPTGLTPASVNLQMANRDKTNLAPMEGVVEAAKDILGEESKTRGVVITFNPKRDKMVAAVHIPKTDDWKQDWESLQDAMPKDDVAAAIFSFPYWAGPAAETSKPVLFTSRPRSVDFKTQYLAGYWLGPLIIASEGIHKVKSFAGENYFEMCEKLEIDPELCQLENQFHECPFAGDDTEETPCTKKDESGRNVCGGSYIEEAVDTGSISKDCCAAIDAYCSEDAERMGCRGETLEMITANCNAPMPETEVTPLMEFYLTQQCGAKCAKVRCVNFEDPNETYQLCAGCKGDHREYKCSPSQPGFIGMRCGGADEKCVNSKNEPECVIHGDLCVWGDIQQTAAFEAAASTEDEGEGEGEESSE